MKNKKKGPIQYNSWFQAVTTPMVIVLLGFRGYGKSALAWYLAEIFHERKSLKVGCIGLPKKKQKLVPGWVLHADDLEKLPTHSIAIVDEAALRFSARRYNSDPNVLMQAMIALSRQKHQIIIFIAHVSRLLDVTDIMESDLVIFKKPSLAHCAFERPQIAKFTKEAYDALLAKNDPKKWSYIINFHDGQRGILKNPLPKFWTEDLSEAWADTDIRLLKTPAKEKKVKSVLAQYS